jgi:hypothetical protein
VPTIEVRWIVSAATSGLYAAAAVANGRTLVDSALSESLSAVLAESLPRLAGISSRALLEHLIPLSAGITSPSELARLALVKAAGRCDSTAAVSEVVAWLRQIATAFCQAHPRCLEQLELRSGPLREQWEARGAGLMAAWARTVGEELLVPRADVVLVEPVLGGGGWAHLEYNTISFEAVLANPLPELPEVVRLAWLLAQLNLEVPAIRGELPRDRLRRAGALAMIPPILDAAAYVELVRPSDELAARAAEVWLGERVDPAMFTAWRQTRQQ